MADIEYIYNTMDGNMLKECLRTDYKKDSYPQVECVSKGIILPRIENGYDWGWGGVVDSCGNFIELSRQKSFGGYYEYDTRDIVYCDYDVIYLGYLIDHWGTFLFDLSRRLYYYFMQSAKSKIAFCGIGFKEDTFGTNTKNCEDFFCILGIKKADVIDVRVPMQFRNVFVPEPAYEFGKFIYKEFLLPFKYAVKSYKINSYKKIYLSRCKFRPQKESGEYIIEKFFRNNGFEIYYPELLTVEKQIEIVQSAKVIASIEGTISHNCLFAQPGTKQVIIRKRKGMNSRQILFNQIANIDLTYIDCYYEPFKKYPVSHDTGPFLILFNRNIKKWANDNGLKYNHEYRLFNIISFVWYVVLCLKSRLGSSKIYKKFLEPIYSLLIKPLIFPRESFE